MDNHRSLLGTEVSRCQEPGAVLRFVRKERHLTLAEAGQMAGYSAATMSRFETGARPLTDVGTLRHLAAVFSIPPQLFGLTAVNGEAESRTRPAPPRPRHAGFTDQQTREANGNTVSDNQQWEDGEDPVRRRDMLTGTVALAGAAALGGFQGDQAGKPVTLTDVLYGRSAAAPIPISSLRAAVTAARRDFQVARYGQVSAVLPSLLAAARATSDTAGTAERGDVASILADAYLVAADFAVKINDDPLSWLTSDRALQAALAGNDAVTLADARRSVATAMRRAGYSGRAGELIVQASQDITPSDFADPDSLAMYGTLLSVAAYTAATGGNRDAAKDYISEAQAVLGQLGSQRSIRLPGFNTAGVALYRVSIAQVLGDNGTAIEHAKNVRIAEIPTPERRGRYWVDVARAYHQWGKPVPCYRALLAAERAAPAEVRFRPPVHRMTRDLVRARQASSMPGLRQFAQRIGLPE
jgi:transcriptional regulator with XRE-family HTH domain